MSRTADQAVSGRAWMRISLRIRGHVRAPSGVIVTGGGRDALENLAISLRRTAERARRHAGGAVERADEVGEVAKPYVERDVGDRAGSPRQKARRAAESRANQELVRCHADDGRKTRKK